MFIIPVSEELHLLLIKAQYLGAFDVELFPVANSISYKVDKESTLVNSQILKDFIESKTVYIPLNNEGTYQDALELENETLEDTLRDIIE